MLLKLRGKTESLFLLGLKKVSCLEIFIVIMFVLFCCCYDMLLFRATFIPLYLKFPSVVKLA